MGRYIWAYWISPFAYLLRAVVINEMTSPAWRTPVATQGGGTTTTTGEVEPAGSCMGTRLPKSSTTSWNMNVS